MNSRDASRQFDLNVFLDKISNLGMLDLLERLQKEIYSAERTSISTSLKSYRDIQRLKEKYISDLKAFFSLLQTGKKPTTVSKDLTKKFDDIINGLKSN